MTPVTQVSGPRHVRRWLSGVAAVGLATAAVVLAVVGGTPAAWAAQPTVGLGTAGSFAVLAGTTVTNTGPTNVAGDLGVSPGNAVTGFPPGQVRNGTRHVADAVARQAQGDLTRGYNDAAGRTPATVLASSELGGQTLVAGVYKVASAMSLTGTVTLDARGDPNAVFIFQAGSTLITGSSSRVRVLGASACNVFWQVGSSATLGTDTTFVGTVMALTSVSVQTGTTVAGRVLARNGQVSLDNNRFIGTGCVAGHPSPGPSASGSASPSASASPSSSAVVPATTTPTAGPTRAAVIPSGHPQTGAGGTFHAGSGIVTVIGVVALIGAVLAMGQAVRRRRDSAAVNAGPIDPGVDG